MIVGTAGHIDHGKTHLVRALTGIDTDRLKEEKARGISIELGYAYVPVEGGAGVLGFVDVPGHERFVHTMVAGASGIDFALLVVAADDGVMPQTREHLHILELLGVNRGAVVLSKRDRVDAARLAEVRAQVAALLASSPLQDAPFFACNGTDPDDPGVRALRAHLHAVAAGTPEAPGAADELFRMPVDRVFSLPGHGTMIAGTVHGGRIAVETASATPTNPATPGPRLMPQDLAVRVRSLHAQGRPAEQATAGLRCALNLAAVAREQVARGDWLADPRAFIPALRVDVRLHLLDGDARRLRDGAPLHVHWGTMHRLAHALVLDAGAPGSAAGVDGHDGRNREARGRDAAGGVAGGAAGGAAMTSPDAPSDTARAGRAPALVQLVFDTPVCAMCGDRFIVRNAAATATIGGGVVLDCEPPRRGRRHAARLAWLRALARRVDGEGLQPLLDAASSGLPLAALVRYARLPAERLPLPADALRIATSEGEQVILAAHWEALGARVLEALQTWHAQHPDEAGVDAGRLQRSTLPRLAPGLWRARLTALHAEGRVARSGAWWRMPGHGQALSTRERSLLDRLLPAVQAGGFDPPWVRTLATQLGEAEDSVRAVLRLAAARGEAFQIVPDLFYTPQRIAELATILDGLTRGGDSGDSEDRRAPADADPAAPLDASAATAGTGRAPAPGEGRPPARGGGVGAAAFRDAVGIGRKRSIQILEFFNRAGYTRRVGDVHMPRPDMHGVPWQTQAVE